MSAIGDFPLSYDIRLKTSEPNDIEITIAQRRVVELGFLNGTAFIGRAHFLFGKAVSAAVEWLATS